MDHALEIAFNIFSTVVLIGCGVMFGMVGLNVVLGWTWLAPVRRALCQSRHRWLAVILPFGPAASLGVMSSGTIPKSLGIWLPFVGLSMVLSTYFSAILAGYWLALPRDPDQPLRAGLCMVLGTVLLCAGGASVIAVIGNID